MERTWSSLPYSHISKAVDKTISIVDGRRKGRIKSLKTSSEKVNKVTLNGFEWNRILTIAGKSGSGKSLWTEQLKREFCDENPDQNFEILSFEFEMLATDQVVRNISGRIGMSTKDIYSGTKTVSDAQFETIKQASDPLKGYPIYYVDKAGTSDEIWNTVMTFAKQRELQETDSGLVVTIDHVLLTKGNQTDAEKTIIDKLCKKCIELKKYFESRGMKILIILVSQLNREILKPERVLKRELHYPTMSDIFGASSLYHASDYVFIIHKPASVDGIGDVYGPNNYPIFNPDNQEQACIYIHVLKERFGQPCILWMLDNFKNSKVDEYKRKQNNQT